MASFRSSVFSLFTAASFGPDEDRPGSNHEVILTYKFWQARYGSDPNVLGRPINLDGATVHDRRRDGSQDDQA